MDDTKNENALAKNSDLSAAFDVPVPTDEVGRIWRETEWMSPQTPIEVRRAVLKLKEQGHAVTGVDQVIMQAVLDLRAALYRDESKFAHLVAGTETIVDKLQEVNKWEAIVERLETRLDETNLLVQRLVELKDRPSLFSRALGAVSYILFGDPAPPEEEPTTAHQPEVEEPFDRHIGSNWDKTNPRKK